MSRTTIISVKAREVYSLRGHPGIEARVKTENGATGVAVCTAGLSIGTFEVPFKYDGGERFEGKGVRKAVAGIDEVVAPALVGQDAACQVTIDDILIKLNGPEAKTPVGGNATAAVSAAVLKAGAAALDIPLYAHIGGIGATRLPVPGIIGFVGSARYGGGEKAFGKPSHSFMAYDFPSFSEASYALWVVKRAWHKIIEKKFGKTWVFQDRLCIDAGMVKSDEDVWALMTETINKCGYENKVGIQVDVASDTYYDKTQKVYTGLFSSGSKNRDDMIELYTRMVKEYPFVIIEDPLNEEDYEGHAMVTESLDIQVVGDDLFTTNTERVKKGIKTGAANTVLLKVNQIGTISQSAEMIKLAYDNGYGVMPCESRGEGIAICDYCVGFGTGTVRESGLFDFGNRFMEIEAELGSRVRFAGKHGLKGKRFELKNSI